VLYSLLCGSDNGGVVAGVNADGLRLTVKPASGLPLLPSPVGCILGGLLLSCPRRKIVAAYLRVPWRDNG